MKATTSRTCTAAAALALLLSLQMPASGHDNAPASAEAIDALLADVRRATAPFHDVQAARAAGYEQFLGCVSQPGQGAMGSTI